MERRYHVIMTLDELKTIRVWLKRIYAAKSTYSDNPCYDFETIKSIIDDLDHNIKYYEQNPNAYSSLEDQIKEFKEHNEKLHRERDFYKKWAYERIRDLNEKISLLEHQNASLHRSVSTLNDKNILLKDSLREARSLVIPYGKIKELEKEIERLKRTLDLNITAHTKTAQEKLKMEYRLQELETLLTEKDKQIKEHIAYQTKLCDVINQHNEIQYKWKLSSGCW